MNIAGRLFTIAVVVLLTVAGVAHAQTWDAGDSGNPTDWFHMDNWNPNVLPSTGSTTSDTLGNASCPAGCLRIEYTSKPFAVSALPDPGIGSFHAEAPSGNSFRFRMTKDVDPANVNILTTTGDSGGNANFWHNGAGTYVLQIDGGSQLSVGDAAHAFLPVGVDADFYGFKLDFDGLDAHVSVTDTFGFGPVDLTDATGEIRTGHQMETLSIANAGTIDCTFAGDGIAANDDPFNDSPWRINDTTADPNETALHIQAGKIIQVANWNFVPDEYTPALDLGGPVEIETSLFEMYETDGLFQAHRVKLLVTNEVQIFQGAPPPRISFGDTSRLPYTHSAQSNNHFFIESAPSAATPIAAFEFTSPFALLRPFEYPDPAEYVGQEFSQSLFVKFANRAPAKMEVLSRVAEGDYALAFDASYMDLELGNESFITAEAFAQDQCNLMYLDFLHPQSNCQTSGPVSCEPKFNRCTKTFHGLAINSNMEPALTLIDVHDNYVPDYAPVGGEPPEAAYFCDALADTGSIAMMPSNLRMYVRTISGAGTPILPLKFLTLTRYMDADGDFDVDVHDFARFQNSFSGDGKVTWFALADYATGPAGEVPYDGAAVVVNEADCDCDLDDFRFLFGHWHQTFSVLIDDNLDCVLDPETESHDVVRVCNGTEPSWPNENDGYENGSPRTVVCGGPLHVRPGNCPMPECQSGEPEDCGLDPNSNPICEPGPLDCPDGLYPPLFYASGGGAGLGDGGGGGASSMSAPSGGGEDFNGADGDSGGGGDPLLADNAPPQPLPPAEDLAAYLLATFSSDELGDIAATLAAETNPADQPVAQAVAALLSGGSTGG